MAACTDHKNPLQRSGTSQQQRFLAALDTQYASVDESQYADWIVFAREFARYIKYIDNTGAAATDWEPFFSKDISARLGTVAVQDITAYSEDIRQRLEFLKEKDHVVQLPACKEKLNQLFSLLFSLSKAMDDFVTQLPDEVELKNTLSAIITSRLTPSLQRLIGYYKGAKQLSLLRKGGLEGWRVMNVNVQDASVFLGQKELSELWFVQTSTITTWTDFVASVDAEQGLFGDDNLVNTIKADYAVNPFYTEDEWVEMLRLNHAARHNLFASVFDQYISAYTRFISESEKQLLLTMEQWPEHTPHYALFLAFLKLFRIAKDHLNTLTQRHLDFYYKDVLRLTPREAQSNSAHVLIQLAKQTESFALAQGTLFKAGKDSQGKEVLYALDKEQTFNKASVVKLMSVYKGIVDSNENDNILDENENVIHNNNGRLFASPVANSTDGAGAALDKEAPEWHPLVNKIYADGKLQQINMPLAQTGFCIASHYLYLAEGVRTIKLRIAAVNPADHAKLAGVSFQLWLTTEKEWYLASANAVFSADAGLFLMSHYGTSCAEMEFTIPAEAPAIVNYNAEKHGGTLNVALPVMKLIVNNDLTVAYNYNDLKDIQIATTELVVTVGGYAESVHETKGIKQLTLSNDSGTIDASKPFMPFGALPKKDASLVIGSKEIFCKKRAVVKLNIEWADFPATSGAIDFDETEDSVNPKVIPQYLAGGQWQNAISPGASYDILTGASFHSLFMLDGGSSLPDAVINDYTFNYEPLTAFSKNGFIRLKLNQSFGHKKYQAKLTEYLLKEATESTADDISEPTEPYTPVIQSLYLSYTAFTSLDFTDNSEDDFTQREVRFFHQYPFGEAEQHGYLNSGLKYLMPQFSHQSPLGKIDHHGEFFVGIKNLQPLQSVALLFQLKEGSTDPLLIKPSEHIVWSYLSNNEWRTFNAQQISDTTLQLTQSGIIQFVIPQDATSNNTLLETGLIWLKAGIEKAAEAVCKLFAVHAQAARVTFYPSGNAADFLNTPLPADSIKKLKVPVAEVKKPEQPYSSFGGRPAETEEHFYVRVSERLRHKARAITIWDYERLVLEAFPDIYKVKCLNHTRIDEGVYNEVCPGYVSIITIPTLQNRNDVNPLQPYTSQSRLTEIEQFLAKKISCHVKLKAAHPQFEEVRVECKMKLASGFSDFTYYSALLQTEIMQYLTPWVYDSNSDIEFGGKIYKSSLINFIEERGYVDFITDVKLFHTPGEGETEVTVDEEVVASVSRSILVSAPASKHVILNADEYVMTAIPECEPPIPVVS